MPQSDGRAAYRTGCVEVTLFVTALLAVRGRHPSPATAVFGLAVWAAFLASIPSRGHEAVPSRPKSAKGVD